MPHRIASRAGAAGRDVQLQQFVNRATDIRDHARVEALDAAFGSRTEAVRTLAGQIKQHTLDHLDHYVGQFADAATAAGVHVHFAADGPAANEICLAIARRRGCRRCVKSKSMVTEETKLVPALQAAGIEAVETDLGEFIIQLDDDAPSHIVAPMIHKDRRAVGRAFEREIGAPYTEDPAELTAIARAHMRVQYQRADLGVSGANFLVAETGTVVICTNEGNADLSVSGPPVHIAFVGIEKLVPRLQDLPVFLKLLARSATAQPITIYTTMLTGPRRAADHDGPEEMHVILVDNGRTRLLAPDTRELLRCIRCGACLNTCPVYRKVGGGHAYGAVYSGPIGATITPLLAGLENYPDLPHASSLCGACFDACPVRIDLPGQLVRRRREMVETRVTGLLERSLMRAWAWSLRGPRRYRMATRLQRVGLRALGRAGWIRRAPPPLAGWTRERDLPVPARRSFHDWWKKRERGGRP
ncbi:MAG: iron-sulfur cluster-binding protein [Phycisphaerales bacterium]|nr:iron-sulfur cluster-binding protein [Phycisphaerales bacterium]